MTTQYDHLRPRQHAGGIACFVCENCTGQMKAGIFLSAYLCARWSDAGRKVDRGLGTGGIPDWEQPIRDWPLDRGLFTESVDIFQELKSEAGTGFIPDQLAIRAVRYALVRYNFCTGSTGLVWRR